MSKLAKALSGAAGNAGGDPLYVEDVFSTYLYDGTGAVKTITNGIDLDGEGGVVWIKQRSGTEKHVLAYDENKYLSSNTTDAVTTNVNYVQSFNSNGFQVGVAGPVNTNGSTYASWTFRKAEKFFDVVTYTGNGTAGRTVAHNLGSVPAMMIVKCTNASATKWIIYHASLGATKYLLFTTGAAGTFTNFWNDTAPTDSVFSLGVNGQVNGNGDSFVAYLFASDAGGFGDDEDENIIKCGSYTGNNSVAGPTINLGFEPQWVLIKQSSAAGENWVLADNMRGVATGGNDAYLFPNTTNTENSNGARDFIEFNATGFTLKNNYGFTNASATYIYMAIRRGPMKTPEAGTEVFASQNPGIPLNSAGEAFTSGFPVDWALSKEVSATDDWLAMSRLQGAGNFLETNTTDAEASGITYGTFDHMTGWYSTASANMSWMFRRATGFMDVVAYTGNGTYDGSYNVNHNLTVAPEMIIAKSRNNTDYWSVYHTGLTSDTYQINLNLTSAELNTGQSWGPISTTFKPQYAGNTNYSKNVSARTYIAYLFATVAGVSKVGSYTGTGSSLDVPCGFTAGARFILIKRSDSAGDWYIYDSTRGISALGTNDPYLFINTAAVQVTNTDYVASLSTGFNVTSNASSTINVNGGTYIFLAIA